MDNAALDVTDGTTFTPGTPAVEQTFSPLTITLRYVRRKSYIADGLTYTPKFAADGMTFVPDPDNPVPTVVSDDGGEYQVVEVPFLLFDSNGMKADAMLGEVEVTLTP